MNLKHTFSVLLVGFISISFGQEILQHKQHTLESHGYLRTGLGRSLSGGEMVEFMAPGAMVKPRFGNEANHYSELQFDYRYQPNDRRDSYEIVYMMATYLAYGSTDLTKSIKPETSQLYFKWNKFYKEADIWIGRRYYQRENIDILDWFWINSGQGADVGVGLENLTFNSKMNLNVALLRFSDKLQDPAHQGELFEDYKIDARLKDISLSTNLNLNLIGQIGFRNGIDNSIYDEKTGFTLGAWTNYTQDNFRNRTTIIYRDGVNMINNPYSGKGLLEVSATGNQVYDLDKANDLQILTDIQYENNSNGFLGAITYEHKDFGIKTAKGEDKTLDHMNVTGRYSRYLSDRYALTFDVGYDYVNHNDGVAGGVFKATFSPEIKWKKGMFSRPSIRPFITYAKWSEDLKGQVGIVNDNDVYVDKTNGVTAGLQLEVWW
ncbi:MAG: carbohydrate porin [Weeksellaceae bacterium]